MQDKDYIVAASTFCFLWVFAMSLCLRRAAVGRTSICLEMVWLGTVIDLERRQGQTDANEMSGVWCTHACKPGHREAEQLAGVVFVSDTADFLADLGHLVMLALLFV